MMIGGINNVNTNDVLALRQRTQIIQQNLAVQALKQSGLVQGNLAELKKTAKPLANEMTPDKNIDLLKGDEPKKEKADKAGQTGSNEQRVMSLRAQIAALESKFKKFELEYNELIRKMGRDSKDPKEFSSALPMASLMGLKRTTLKDRYSDDVEGLQKKMAGVLQQISQLQSVIATLMSAGLPQVSNFTGFEAIA